MSSTDHGTQVWRPSRKQLALVITAIAVLAAAVVLTLPEDKVKPLRATSVSRPSESAAGTQAPAPSSAPIAISKPAEGRYVYRGTVDSGGKRSEEETSWLVSHGDGDSLEKTSAVGQGGPPDRQSQVYTERWSAAAVTRTTIQFPAEADGSAGRRCTMTPPLLELPVPVEIGMRWESAAHCGEGDNRMTYEHAGHVLRTERIAVAGTELDTLVIELSSGRGRRGLVWLATDGTEWFAPALGMAVRQTTLTRETETGSGFRRERTSELVAWPGGPAA